MARIAYMIAGWIAMLAGLIGLALPLIPTVPFMILAAFCFARGNPAIEARLLTHPQIGPHIRAWRERGAISRRGKFAAIGAFSASAIMGFVFAPWPWQLLPLGVALIGGSWVWCRPD